MRRVLLLGLVFSSVAFALRIVGQLSVFAPDGSTVVAFGEDAGTSAFTMQNVGGASLAVSSITLLGDDAGVFSLDGGPLTIARSSEVQVGVTFRPAVPGSYSARVVIVSDSPRNSELVLCAPPPCDPPQPPPEPVPPPRGCTSVGWLAPGLAMLLARRRGR